MPSTSTSMSAQRCFTAWKLADGPAELDAVLGVLRPSSRGHGAAAPSISADSQRWRPGRGARRRASGPPRRGAGAAVQREPRHGCGSGPWPAPARRSSGVLGGQGEERRRPVAWWRTPPPRRPPARRRPGRRGPRASTRPAGRALGHHGVGRRDQATAPTASPPAEPSAHRPATPAACAERGAGRRVDPSADGRGRAPRRQDGAEKGTGATCRPSCSHSTAISTRPSPSPPSLGRPLDRRASPARPWPPTARRVEVASPVGHLAHPGRRAAGRRAARRPRPAARLWSSESSKSTPARLPTAGRPSLTPVSC